MFLLIPLFLIAIVVRVIAYLLAARGYGFATAWNSWSAAAAAGMAAVFCSTAVTHFVEPQRSGLIAIVPDVVPFPELAVTFTGVVEILLAFGLLVPRTRRLAALFSVVLLIVLFPANIVAATGVEHPAAPSTPLVPRTVLQLVFISCAAAPLITHWRWKRSVRPARDEQPATTINQ